MNNVDLYLAIFSIVLFVFGMRDGIVRTALAIILTFVSAVFALSASSFLGSGFSAIFGGGSDVQSSRAILFIVIFVFLNIISEIILIVGKTLVNIKLLWPLDIWVGGLLGVFRALIIGAAICDMLILMPISLQTRDALDTSILRSYAEGILNATFPIAVSTGPAVQSFFSNTIVPAVSNIKPISFEAVGSLMNIKPGKDPVVGKPAISFVDEPSQIKPIDLTSEITKAATQAYKRFTP